MTNGLTFRDFKIKQRAGAEVYVTATCNETGREAYVMISVPAENADAISRARIEFERLKP